MLLCLTLYLHLNQKGLHLLRTWPWCWEGSHCHPLGFLPWAQMTLQYCLWRMFTSMELCLWEACWTSLPWSHYKWPSHIPWWLVRSTTTFRPRASPGGPSQALPPSDTLTLSKDQGTLSDHNAPLDSGNTFPKHWPEQIPTLQIKWTLDQANTHSQPKKKTI